MVRRRGEVIWRPVDGQVVGLDLRSSRYFSLNGTASVLWAALENEVAPGDLADALVREFGIGAAEATRDVEAFLGELRRSGLVEE